VTLVSHYHEVSQVITDNTPAVSSLQTGVVSHNARSSAVSTTDAVPRAIEAFAVTERRRNFHFLARYSHHRMGYEDLSVYHAALESIEKVKRVWEVTPDMIAGSVWYTFFQPYWKIADTVPLRYKRNGQVIALTPSQASTTIAGAASAPPIDHEIVERDLQATSDTVLDARIDIQLDHIEAMDVEDTQCWMPLCAWMRKKYEWHDDRDWTQRGGRQLQLENQITWWKCNGKHFNFLALPGELRNAVYSESLGPGIDNPNTQILLVTRDIQAEAVAA
jgi:hypothetical protein